jgi:hypothetical protein
MSQSANTTTSETQKQSFETSTNSINSNDINAGKPIEQEFVFILENGTEPTPVRAIRRPEPQLRAPIHVPFPPAIKAVDLIRTNKNGTLLARCTNKFLIYRNEFAREVRTQGYNLSMSEVSCLAAQAWKKEPNYVIRKYADIAHEVKWLHKQLSRSNSRNKRKNSLSSPFNPTSSVGEQTIYTTQQKRANLLTQQLPPEMFRLNNQDHQHNTSPLISSPLTPSTLLSPTFMYHPRISETNVATSLNAVANLEMISPYGIPVDYYGELFSMSSKWVYNNQLYLHGS